LTLYRWGNSLITKIEKEGDKITSVYVKLTPEDTVFKNTKIVHWVPVGDNLSTKVLLVEFDHLMKIRSMKTEDISEIANTNSRFETLALAEISILGMNKGDVIQLERRGNFYVDKLPSESKSGMFELNFVPDGKTKSMSGLATKVDAKTLTKGTEESKKSKDKKKDKEAGKKEKEKHAAENAKTTTEAITEDTKATDAKPADDK
jgi:hypothetical protein